MIRTITLDRDIRPRAAAPVTPEVVAGSLWATVTDAELVGRIVAGDVEAFGVVVDRYQPMMGRYARQMLGNSADAEEAVQDALVRGYRALAKCRQPDKLASWLLAILANRCRSMLRRRWWREQRLKLAGNGALSGEPPDIAGTVASRDMIDRMLQRLDQRQREAFLLHHVEGLNYQEMSQLTGAGVSALKMRVKRACDSMRIWLEEVDD